MDRERIIENQTVLVRDGRIAEIGPSSKVKVPAGPETIDGKGKYLMPGLAEMHGHLPGPNQGDQFGTIEVGKRADMILLNENPLKDVGNVWKRAGVMVRGRWLSESEIQSMLEKIAGGQ
jgi:imidazolonepropionase-like amidohydrolase